MKSEHTVFVGGLNFKTPDESLRAYFDASAEVVSARIARDLEGKSRGYGFVTFRDAASAANVIAELDRSELEGWAVNLKPAHQRAPAPHPMAMASGLKPVA